MNLNNLPGWTTPLVDDGWVGEDQKFPTTRQVVCWTDCPTCGAERGTYCSAGLVVKKTGEMLDLAGWVEANNGHGAPAPSCAMRRQRARGELRKRINAEKRRLKQIQKAMDWYYEERNKRRGDQTEALF